jgi:hypothetical protein
VIAPAILVIVAGVIIVVVSKANADFQTAAWYNP